MDKKETKEILIDKFIELRSIDKLFDYLIEKDFIRTEQLTIAQIRGQYFIRAKKNNLTLTQIMSDLATEYNVSEKTIEYYIYTKKDINM